MIKKAEGSKINEVLEYFKSKGHQSMSSNFYYSEDENGRINGAYGVELKLCIEPLLADNNFIGHELMVDAVATVRPLVKDSEIHCFTSNQTLIDLLKHRAKAEIFGKNLTELIIKL